jgi:predicted Zn-dependent protease with MMP-like domain
MDDKDFEALVAAAIDAIPPRYADHMKNIGFVIEDDPTPEQRLRLHLVGGQTLYGLYEGIPLTKRTNSYSGVLPDKITIFKNPIVSQAADPGHLQEIVKNTVWHEVAHHFGLDHGRIHELEQR